MRRSVAILGGGVGGMSAAHELAERGFSVTVYEARDALGGKARSICVPGTGLHGRRGLPGEHGFRLFPSFYRHLPDTMARIPFRWNPRGVADNFVSTRRTRLARAEGPPLDVVSRFPRDIHDWRSAWQAVRRRDVTGIPDDEFTTFARTILTVLTTCEERRLGEYENISYWSYLDAQRRSPSFRLYFGQVALRVMAAMRPEAASLRTVGTIGLQLLLDHFRPGQEVNRLLNGPTSDAWLLPWRSYLEQLGVRFRKSTPIVSLQCQRDRVASVRVMGTDGPEEVRADFYVAALPVEAMVRLLDGPLLEADPRLALLRQLETAWMVGIQFFLRRDVPLVRGHVVLVDSPWALSCVSQPQFWEEGALERYGDGRVEGLFSVVISDWDRPGQFVQKPARECTRDEVAREVWQQLKVHLNRDGDVELRDADLACWYLAESIEYRPGGEVHNSEPLLTNTVGSWWCRPDATTALPNLFLASDYVRTHTDLATMEGANEAARRAVNAILAESDSHHAPCLLWPLEEPALFQPLKGLDLLRYRMGLPHAMAPGGPSKGRERSVGSASRETFEQVRAWLLDRGKAA
ncbi:MAG: FAD-dependent oxidoreductase [Myxococcaceae bacterium]|nr:FAD-dependent oxidoreductase [Myxococcaceae bacterium]MCI0671231.1 FAD-dependent oxidoreductase [Myxococcaceae bacterium]